MRLARTSIPALAVALLSFPIALAGDVGAKKGDLAVTTKVARSERVEKAITLAREVRARAHAPYSNFRMGAAVGTDKGILVPGTLVENVSLGLAMCAERVALFSAVALDAGRPDLLVLVSPRTDGDLTFPCGACLQVAQELGGPDLHVEACDLEGRCEGAALRDLAPKLPRKDR